METEENVKFVRFTITEDEIKEVAEEIDVYNLSDEQVKDVLTMVECDEMLAKDIRTAIVSAVLDL